MLRFLAMLAALILPALVARAEEPSDQLRPGEVYAIRREVNSSETSTGLTGTGTTHDVDIVIERVIAVRDAGVELEFDLPRGAPGDEEARDWKFPARVLAPAHGPLQLLNRPELEARLEQWLRAAGMPRQACEHWIFTWNAFQIECDPQSVIRVLQPFILWPDDLRDGAPWQQEGSHASVTLQQERYGSGRTIFVARMEIDPEAVRREHVHADLVLAEIMHRSLTPEAAARARAAEQISGTMTTTFEMASGEHGRLRTTVTEVDTDGPDGRRHRTVTETVERRLMTTASRGRKP